MSGMVYLVGSGPGDPGLLTLRGAEALRRADVVVYDRLAPEALLDLAPSRAERIDVGKVPGASRIDQETINRLIVNRARGGRTVVRLKGGDPFVFGRGGEEALACSKAGIAFEVVPGVSSAIAGPAYLGIPVTHRGLSSSFTVLTGTLATGDGPDLDTAGTSAETLVVLMAAGRLEEICGKLIDGGRDPGEPAALVEWATTSRQRSVVSTLRNLPGEARDERLGPPATLVVGSVVTLSAELAWFGSSADEREDELPA